MWKFLISERGREEKEPYAQNGQPVSKLIYKRVYMPCATAVWVFWKSNCAFSFIHRYAPVLSLLSVYLNSLFASMY